MDSSCQNSSEFRVYQAILNAMGPILRSLLEEDDVIELALNPDGLLWVERMSEGMSLLGRVLSKNDSEALIRLMASYCGQSCNENSPALSCIMPVSNARFQAFLPPVVDAPSFSIRKRALRVFTLEDTVQAGVLSDYQRDFLVGAILKRDNILVIGGTGTGKTTLANAILQEIAKTEDRVVVLEDTPELQCNSKNKVHLYTKPDIGFTMQKAVCEVMRYRPDRIIVGEVRDGSALDLLKAWNTGHSGGICTLHASSARLGLRRLESLISEVAVNVPRDLIAEAIHVLVHIKREAGKRFVNEILELKGLDENGYSLQPIAF